MKMINHESQRPLLEFRGAVVARSGKHILSIDALDLYEGENVAVLGPNGSGKSTFIQLITREVFPLHRDDPPVRFKGSERVLLTEVKQCIGVVSSSMQHQIMVHLPVREIVAGGLFGSLGIPMFCEVTEESAKQVQQSMELLGIADLADRNMKTLSTGQARRVLFARALVHNPSVLILDEPCTGLDPEGMHNIRQCMRSMAAAGKTIVLVTHYPEDLVPEISRVVLLKEGKVFADGPKEDTLTSETMEALFEAPLQIQRRGAYYSLVSDY